MRARRAVCGRYHPGSRADRHRL